MERLTEQIDYFTLIGDPSTPEELREYDQMVDSLFDLVEELF